MSDPLDATRVFSRKLRVLERNTVVPSPWKNGGGKTYELLIHPRGSNLDTFDWRVSIAAISSDGPFSLFPNIDRTLLLLEGGGVSLDLTEDTEETRYVMDTSLVPFSFKGETHIYSKLLGSNCLDFNVMVNRTRYSSKTTVFSAIESELGHFKSLVVSRYEYSLVYVPQGEWRISCEDDRDEIIQKDSFMIFSTDISSREESNLASSFVLIPTSTDSTIIVVQFIKNK